MAQKRDRAIAGFFAILFLLSISTVTVGVIIQIVQTHDSKDKSAKEAPVDTTKKLQGTKLAGFTPVAKVSALSSTDTKVGSGDVVKAGDTITFHYTGALAADGTIFQSSHDTGQPITYALKDLIPGWQQGIPGMKVGGERRLLIPYAQGYGEAGAPDGGIPPKADLVFDIEITAIKK